MTIFKKFGAISFFVSIIICTGALANLSHLPDETVAEVVKFCHGDWADRSKFFDYLDGFQRSGVIRSEWDSIWLSEGFRGELRFPDKSAIKIVESLGLKKDRSNSYEFVVNIFCLDRDIGFVSKN